MKHFCIILLLALITVSCSRRIDILPFDIDKVQTQIRQNPDSIANILEGQINPFTLSGQNKADYWFLLTQTHLQQERSLINDSLIHFSVKYYEIKNSPYLSSAYRLAACQINCFGNKSKDEEILLQKAIEIAKKNEDIIEIIEIYDALATSYFNAKEYSKAIDIHKKMIVLAPSSKTKAESMYRIGLEYALLEKSDSCFLFLESAASLAKEHNYLSLQFDILRNYADCLNNFDNSRKAVEIINQANELKGSFSNSYYANFTYLNAWLNLNQLDSAEVYIKYLRKNNADRSPMETEYFSINFITEMFQSVYNEKKGRPAKMLTMAIHGDNVMNSIRNNNSIDKERIFLQNQFSKEKDRIEIEKSQQLQVYLIVVIALLLIISIIIFIYQRKVLNKERFIQDAKERLQENTIKLYENENQIKENNALIKDLTSQIEGNNSTEEELVNIEQIVESNSVLQKQNEILNEEINKFSVLLNKKGYEKISNQNIALQEREKFLLDQLIINHDVLNRLKYSPQFINDEQWVSIINIINVLYNNYPVRLQAEYPTLTEEDIRYCCLIELRLSISTISTLMAVSPTSVSKRKQRIKEKMIKINSKLFSEQSLENYLWNY